MSNPSSQFLLDEFYVRIAFKKELLLIHDPLIEKTAVEMLRRAHPRYFTGPSAPSGKYHPETEYFSGIGGDISGAPPHRGKEYGGQVLHCRRVVVITRHLCSAHSFDIGSPHYDLAIACALTHDIGQYEEGTRGTVQYHETLVRPLTMDIPKLYPELKDRWEALVRLCEVHSGKWGMNEDFYPETELEKLVHDADYLASRRNVGNFDVEINDWTR